MARILGAEQWRGESYTAMKKLYKDPQRILSACMCRTTQNMEKNHWKGAGRIILRAHPDQE